MNKKEIIEIIAKKHDITKKNTEEIVDSVFEVITEAMKNGDKVTLSGFGTFEVRHRNARKGIAPRTKEVIEIPASNAPAFKPSKVLKEAMN